MAPQLRIAKGTHRKDRHGEKAAVGAEQLLAAVPKCPAGKGKEFQKWWKHYCGEMVTTGTLTARDLAPLEMLCDAHQELARAHQVLSEAEADGIDYVPTMGGGMAKHPVFNVIATCRRQIAAYQVNLGFTPTGRSRVPPSITTDKAKVQSMKRRG